MLNQHKSLTLEFDVIPNWDVQEWVRLEKSKGPSYVFIIVSLFDITNTMVCRVAKNTKERLKKAFLSDQCKEIEENNRMGKTRNLFKKIRATKGRNGMDLREVEDIKKRWQEYKKNCTKAALNMPANLENSAVATGLEMVSFHSDPKERQCQRMLKLPHNCTHLAH